MDDKGLVENIARILKVTGASIESTVEIHKANGIAELYAATLPFWIKTRQDLALADSSDYIIDLRTYFPNIWQVRKAQIAGYKPMEIMSEGKFNTKYPDDTETGVPDTLVALDNYNVQFYPRPNEAYTVKVSYFYSPALDTITEVPSLWQFIIQKYILAMMWPDIAMRPAMLRAFEKGLDSLAANAKPFTDSAIDIIGSPDNVAIYGNMEITR